MQITQGDDAPGMQIKDHSQIKPPLAGPDVADVTGLLPGSGLPANHERAFLVRHGCMEVAIQQVWGDVEHVIAIRGRLEFACSFNDYPILTHQPPDPPVPNIDPNVFQFFRHPRAAPYGG